MRYIFSFNAGQEVYDICNEGVLNVHFILLKVPVLGSVMRFNVLVNILSIREK